MKYIILFTDRNGTESYLQRESSNSWGYVTGEKFAHRFKSQSNALLTLANLDGIHIEINESDTIEIVPINE